MNDNPRKPGRTAFWSARYLAIDLLDQVKRVATEQGKDPRSALRYPNGANNAEARLEQAVDEFCIKPMLGFFASKALTPENSKIIANNLRQLMPGQSSKADELEQTLERFHNEEAHFYDKRRTRSERCGILLAENERTEEEYLQLVGGSPNNIHARPAFDAALKRNVSDQRATDNHATAIDNAVALLYGLGKFRTDNKLTRDELLIRQSLVVSEGIYACNQSQEMVLLKHFSDVLREIDGQMSEKDPVIQARILLARTYIGRISMFYGERYGRPTALIALKMLSATPCTQTGVDVFREIRQLRSSAGNEQRWRKVDMHSRFDGFGGKSIIAAIHRTAKECEDSGEPERALRSWTQYGQYQLAAGNKKAAREALEAGLHVANGNPGGYKPALGELLQLHGLLRMREGDFVGAKVWLKEAKVCLDEAGTKTLADETMRHLTEVRKRLKEIEK